MSSLVIHAKMFVNDNSPGTYQSEDWPLRVIMTRVLTDDFDHSDSDIVRSYSTEQMMARVLTGTCGEKNIDNLDTLTPTAPFEQLLSNNETNTSTVMIAPPAYSEIMSKNTNFIKPFNKN